MYICSKTKPTKNPVRNHSVTVLFVHLVSIIDLNRAIFSCFVFCARYFASKAWMWTRKGKSDRTEGSTYRFLYCCLHLLSFVYRLKLIFNFLFFYSNYYSSLSGLPATTDESPAIQVDALQPLSRNGKSKRRAAERASAIIAAASEATKLETTSGDSFVDSESDSDVDESAQKRGRVKGSGSKAEKSVNSFLAFSYTVRCETLTDLHNAFLANEPNLDELASVGALVREIDSPVAQDMDVQR